MKDLERAELDRIRRVVARHAIQTLTIPGDLMADLGCGTGAALIEAMRAGRMAIGIEPSPRLASEALANIAGVTANDIPGFAAVAVGDPIDAALLVGADVLGEVRLALINLAGADVPIESLTDGLDACESLLAAGGRVVVSFTCRTRPATRADVEAIHEAAVWAGLEPDDTMGSEFTDSRMTSVIVLRKAVSVS